jgi:phosphonate transport system substrate-binding protein
MTAMADSSSFSIKRLLILVVPILVVAGVGFGFVAMIEPKAFPFKTKLRDFLRDGLVVPTQLDKGFVDADGNLVADPAPASEQIDPPTLVFGVLGDTLDREQEEYADLIKHIEKATGKKVVLELNDEMKPSDLREGHIHLANLGTGSVSTFVNLGGAVPFCVMADSAGKFAYNMEIIVPASSPIKSPADLKHKDISFVSVYSLSGFKAPVVTLWEEFGLQPGRDYEPNMQGSHEMLVKGVAAGQLKAAPVANDLLKRMVAQGRVDGKAIRSIYVSPESFPPACYAYTNRLKPELAAKLKAAFFSFPWEGSSLAKAYSPAGQTKFAPISYKEDWAPVRKLERSALDLVQQLAEEKK